MDDRARESFEFTVLRTFVRNIERDCKPVWPGIVMATVSPDRYVAFHVYEVTGETVRANIFSAAGAPKDLTEEGVRVVLANGLKMLGISAPEQM